ncbi:MAG: hypothetical protein ABIF18_03120 [archaeon]
MIMKKYDKGRAIYLGDIIELCDTPKNSYYITDYEYMDKFSGQIEKCTCVNGVYIGNIANE